MAELHRDESDLEKNKASGWKECEAIRPDCEAPGEH
jgi:hypothetical protein